jgi:RecA/RadA recombinase
MAKKAVKPAPKAKRKASTSRATASVQGTILKFVGERQKVTRFPTHLGSLDYMLDGGWALRCEAEINGYSGSGKSSLMYYIAGCVPTKGIDDPVISVTDMEGLDIDYLDHSISRGGFRGTVKFAKMATPEGEVIGAEATMDDSMDTFDSPNAVAALLDSVSSIVPTAESEGDLADSTMGRRALAMAKYLRRGLQILPNKQTPSIMIFVNHRYQIIGGRGSKTAGGEATMNYPAIRLRAQRSFNASDNFGEAFLINLSLDKLRFRKRADLEPRAAQAFLLPGYGIHVGLSAVFDCLSWGFATRTNGRVDMGGKSYGFLSKMISDKYDDPEFFAPFRLKIEADMEKAGFPDWH